MFSTPTTSHVDYDRVYEPSEDSFLFLDLLQAEQPFLQKYFASSSSFGSPIVVELGIGTGVVITFVHNYILPDALFLGTDVNPYACTSALATSLANRGTRYFEVIRTNLMDSLKPNLVDLLLFNPPYVPDDSLPSYESAMQSDDWLDFALLGGPDGMKITSVVLENLDSILSARGIAYILFCKRNNPQAVARQMQLRGWSVVCIGERKVRWEILSILRFSR
ncbi:uncharacterized protein V1516DRAFT_102665 [Lipomyces oligophaga]|uniref:uncharacterized protein n=1 Tax=Lipomyces oligophaga TaxID=45792 RepID=UPI0034CE56D2